MQAIDTKSVEVRRATELDAEILARLAGELGYPSTVAEVRGRLEAIEGDPRNVVLVATLPGGEVVGWIQVSEVRSLVLEARAEIAGLVVEPQYRCAGIGCKLLERAESWARERGLPMIGLHSNVLRERAHGFYLRLGYRVTKSQKVFRKSL
ncbi:MAG TPA: GNAT family N-acetyltransferase [Candidatus Acidoferrales bacterium]|nr:GNAT family N-acetyltransferase [Candidatus Acidoferrales bacterium]